jgi:hypothetical protein
VEATNFLRKSYHTSDSRRRHPPSFLQLSGINLAGNFIGPTAPLEGKSNCHVLNFRTARAALSAGSLLPEGFSSACAHCLESLPVGGIAMENPLGKKGRINFQHEGQQIELKASNTIGC